MRRYMCERVVAVQQGFTITKQCQNIPADILKLL